jgi:hypothetical protein
MTRIHLFEFTDQTWYPKTFRRIQTDYLQHVTTLGSGHKRLIPFLEKGLRQAGPDTIVDLCSGGGGPWLHLRGELEKAGTHLKVILTDRFPEGVMTNGKKEAKFEGLEYYSNPVDARQVPSDLVGMRTIFEGFHHFPPAEAADILADAARKGAAIGVFEASLPPKVKWLLLIISPFTTILGYLFLTPWIRPVTFTRIFWTYLLPLVPLATCWDGIISMLRVYSVEELADLIDPMKKDGYTWEYGKAATGMAVFEFIYLLGYPVI